MGSEKERPPQVSCYRAGSKSPVSGRGLGLRQKERNGAVFSLFVHLGGTALGSARGTCWSWGLDKATVGGGRLEWEDL